MSRHGKSNKNKSYQPEFYHRPDSSHSGNLRKNLTQFRKDKAERLQANSHYLPKEYKPKLTIQTDQPPQIYQMHSDYETPKFCHGNQEQNLSVAMQLASKRKMEESMRDNKDFNNVKGQQDKDKECPSFGEKDNLSAKLAGSKIIKEGYKKVGLIERKPNQAIGLSWRR